ncbi:suppressor APC domain-containing protein 2 [Scaptodrosophila lebanonensis]|uniref:Suppressor APC domain-containing protein 2 n=1 Tax=Drosophila lebanonensis TaxID=7225 RepID=A0A6J2TVL2_DROLE|nr:suppressor APC domain-containing protein 2 [Scaptodrosophila lebanonensis]
MAHIPTQEMLRQNSNTMLTLNAADMANMSALSVGGKVEHSGSTLDALPKQFVLSMKKLFDILDDKHCGFVRYADIEKGWQDDGSKGLPQGVLDSLRRVTPSSGLLSFDRFCAGLKLCLLRNQQTVSTAPTAKIRPRSQLIQSMPSSLDLEQEFAHVSVNDFGTSAPPPKPPRQPLAKADIRHALQNWQLSLMSDELNAKYKHLKTAREQFEHRGSADGGSSSTSATDYALGMTLGLPPKKSANKRRESRRHTLQHGIDYNMLKRLKQLEEERELLLFGLDGVEKARDWYMQQVLNVQEQIKYFGRRGTRFEQWSEIQQERLNFQRARVLEVNRSLAILTDTWEHGGYPLHINLAFATPTKAQQHFKHYTSSLGSNDVKPRKFNDSLTMHDDERFDLIGQELYELQQQQQQQQQHQQQFHSLRAKRQMSEFVLSQPSPVSQSSAGLGDADVVY